MPIPSIYPRLTPKAVIFDWDNTLVDTSLNILDSINIVFEQFNIKKLKLEEFKQQPTIPLKKYFVSLFGEEKARIAYKMFFNEFSKNHLRSLRALDGAKELLQFLSEKNIFMGVVSNKEGEYLRREVSHMEWDKYFPHTIGCDDTPEAKPSALPLLTLLRKANIDAGHNVWFVGDSSIDMMCAKNAGCVPTAINNAARLSDQPVIELSNFRELHTLIKNMHTP